MGEGWHNNHHAYQSSARQGFRWWEIDPTFYILKMLSLFGLVWDLKTPPLEVRRNKHRLGSRVIERAAAQLAGSFDLDAMVNAIAAALAGPGLSAIQEKLAKAQNRAADVVRRSVLAAIADAARNRQAGVGDVRRHALDGRHRQPRPCRDPRHHRRAASRDGCSALAGSVDRQWRSPGRLPREFRVNKLTRHRESHLWRFPTLVLIAFLAGPQGLGPWTR